MESLEESSWTSPTRTRVTGAERYRVLYELGHGGMARVYLAERSSQGLTKLVVLKVMEPALATDDSMRALFRKEAMICARLNHPNIVQVYEVLDDFRLPAMVMEYIEGVSLWQVRQKPAEVFSPRLQIHILSQVLAALHYFHEIEDSAGVLLNAVHRDVTPQNVIVMHAGVVKVLDFGVAKIRSEGAESEQTQTGVVKGKLKYMPKEQIMGDATIDRRADIFSVGVMLWEALAQKRMWGQKSPPEIYQALFTDQIPDIKEACPQISPVWEEIVRKAIAPNRDDRYQSALEMQLAMECGMEELGGPVRQRELSEFMAAQFGDVKRAQEARLDEERQKPPMPFPGFENTNSYTMIGASRTITPGHLGQNRKKLFLLASAVSIAMLATLYPLYSKLAPASAGQSNELVPHKPVELAITAFPASATIEIDGVSMRNPLKRDFIPTDQARTVVISAKGHQSDTRQLILDRAMSLEVRLAPEATAPKKVDAVNLENLGLEKEDKSANQAPSSTKTAANKSPAPRPVYRKPKMTKTKKANCSPPYRIGPDGVKTFKLECL